MGNEDQVVPALSQPTNLDFVVAALATTIASAQDCRLVPPEACDHVVKVRYNKDQVVCILCRSVIDESNNWGINITVPAPKMEVSNG